MKQARSGRIINISSTAGQRGEAFSSHYAATKGGVISLTKSLAVELAPLGHPRQLRRPGMDRHRHDARRSARAPVASPSSRRSRWDVPATAEEIAGAVVFLASELATFVTGEILNVNGGAVLVG